MGRGFDAHTTERHISVGLVVLAEGGIVEKALMPRRLPAAEILVLAK